MTDSEKRLKFVEAYEALANKYGYYIAPPPSRSLFISKKWGTVDNFFNETMEMIYQDIGYGD